MHNHRTLLLCLVLVMTCSCAAELQGQPSERLVVLDKRSGPLAQDYRLEIFSDGQVLYTGRNRVKRVGEVRFQVLPDQTRRLVDELLSAGIANYQPVRGVSISESLEDMSIAIKSKDVQRALQLSSTANMRFAFEVESIIERHVPTREIRCPYVVNLSEDKVKEELCSLRDVAAKRILSGKMESAYGGDNG